MLEYFKTIKQFQFAWLYGDFIGGLDNGKELYQFSKTEKAMNTWFAQLIDILSLFHG